MKRGAFRTSSTYRVTWHADMDGQLEQGMRLTIKDKLDD
jgi:hypothetical protein